MNRPNRHWRAVYVIAARDRETGALLGTKVGIAGDPENRMTEIHQQLRRDGLWGFRLEMPYCVTVMDAEGTERAAHLALDECRYEGEWFDVPVERAIAAVEAAL